MPETSSNCQILSLHSPAGSDVAIYKWPLHVTDTWNEAHEIAETVRWACSDFPELETAMENCILSHFDPSSYESMKLFCEKYNRAVDNIRKLWSGRQPPACIDVPPTEHHLKHILTQVYNRSIKRPEELNQYEPFSPEVYGETSFELIQEVISITGMSENDVFLDLGSGVGQVVLQVAAAVGCKCYGIEKADIPANYAETMDKEFVKWMDFYGKSYGEYELLRGDFLDSKFDDIINSATVVFCNNFAFGPELDLSLKLKFQNLRDGVKIVSSREFCPLNFRITERTLSDIGAIMRIAPLKGSVSWTGNPVTYYLHMIDRTQLEEFFHRQKHMAELKSEGSTTSFSDGEEREEEEGNDTSSSSSSSSSSEDSSLDSNNEEELFSRSKPELYHFPPSTIFTAAHSDKPHPQATPPAPPRRKSLTSTSSITKKSTPLMGPTHLPHPPHPQSTLHNKKVITSTTRRRGGGTGGRSQSSARNQVKKPLIDKSSLAVLFDSFQKQNEAYLQQLNSAHFQSWLNDAAEKEKMKRKHLLAVIDHLESEVTSLSQETIQSMKKSMLSLGITDLTPEGLLSGAKDIVSLNRQLRKEVQLLEKEVGQLKEQNEAMNVINSQPVVEKKSLTKGNETPPISSSPSASAHIDSHVNLTTPTITYQTTPTPRHSKDKPTNKEIVPTSRLLVEEAIKASEKLPKLESSLARYEIMLESIDQAVLELGPFAKDVSSSNIVTCNNNPNNNGTCTNTVQPSTLTNSSTSEPSKEDMIEVVSTSISSNISVSTNNELMTSTGGIISEDSTSIVGRNEDTVTYKKSENIDVNLGANTTHNYNKDKYSTGQHRSYSPADTTGTSTKGNKRSGRRSRKEETPPTWSCPTPPRPSSVNTPINEATPTNSHVTSKGPSEASAVEAMLALSRPPTHNNEINKGGVSVTMTTTRETNIHSTTPTPSQVSKSNEEVSHTHQSKVKSYSNPPYPYSLPPLSKLPDTVRQRSNSSSSVKSKEDHTPMSSPSLYMSYDNRASPVIRATPTTTPPTTTNPFLPPSLQQQAGQQPQPDANSMMSFQYPYGWGNTSLYRHNFYPTAATALSYPTAHASVDPAHSLDPSLRPVLSPYILRYPSYPSASNITALQGLVTSTTPSLANLQATNLTGGGATGTPSHLSAFKSLHGNFNRSLTPPTLHPLATAQTIDKTTPTVGETLAAQWPLFGQYQPTGMTFSPYTVFPAGTQLTSYGTLGNPTALLQAPPTQEIKRSDEGSSKRSNNNNNKSRDAPNTSTSETYDQRLHYKYATPNEQNDSAIIGRGMSVPTPPRPNSRSNGRGGAKSDTKTPPKIKIHQMNNEDFQEKGVDRRRKKVKNKEMFPQAPVVMSSLPPQRGVVSTPPQEDDTIDVTSIDPLPHPLLIDNSAPLINETPPTKRGDDPVITELISSTNKGAEEEEKDIEIDVDVSSEGTVSASPSPTSSPLHPPSSTSLPLPTSIPPSSLPLPSYSPLSTSQPPSSLPPSSLPLPSYNPLSTSLPPSSLPSLSTSSLTITTTELSNTTPHITTNTSQLVTNNDTIISPNNNKEEERECNEGTITVPSNDQSSLLANYTSTNTSTNSRSSGHKEKEETEKNVISLSSLTNTTTDTSQALPATTPLSLSRYTPVSSPLNDSLMITSKSETPPTSPPTFRTSMCQSTSSELVIDIGSPQQDETPPTQLINEDENDDEPVNKLTNQIRENSEPVIDISKVSQMDFDKEEEEELKSDLNSPLATSASDHTPLISPVEQTWSEFQANAQESVFSSLTPPLSLPSFNDSERHKTDQSNHFSDANNSEAHTTVTYPLSVLSPHEEERSSSHHKKKSHKHHHKSSKHFKTSKDFSSKSHKSSSNHLTTPTSKHHHAHDKLTAAKHETEIHRNFERRSSSSSSHKNDLKLSSHKHRSPNRPRPYALPDDHTHSHHRRRHTPTEERHHKRPTNHTPQYHYDSGRNHCRSHSSTPVPEVISGRGSDKNHTHRSRDTISPNWNSDDAERREWSHHHGDRRKRRGSEGSDEYKYKKLKHNKHGTTINSNSTTSTSTVSRKHHYTPTSDTLHN